MNIVQDGFIPFVAGLVIPFLTHWVRNIGWPEDLETLLNVSLSAAATVALSITFDGDWKTFLTTFFVTWVGAMRGHYTGLPQMLYSNQGTNKHER